MWVWVADQGSDTAIEIPGHSEFLRCGLGVKVTKTIWPDLLQQLIRTPKRVVVGRHEDASLKMTTAYGTPFLLPSYTPSLAIPALVGRRRQAAGRAVLLPSAL